MSGFAASVKSKRLSETKLASLKTIESIFQTYEIHVWQRLRRIAQHTLASEFKSKCSVSNQKFIQDMENANVGISLSYHSLQLVKTVNEYFEFVATENNDADKILFQKATIIREIAQKYDLCDSVEYVARSICKKRNNPSQQADLSQKIGILIQVYTKKTCANKVKMEWLFDLYKELASTQSTTLISQLAFILRCWGVFQWVVDVIVPNLVCDFQSLQQFDFTLLRIEFDGLPVPIGKRKQWQREKQNFFKYSTITDSINNMNISFSELDTANLCAWLHLVNLGEYILLFSALKITGKQLVGDSCCDFLKSLGVLIGHRKFIYRSACISRTT